MFVIYETATGRKISDSIAPIENPKPDIWTVKEVSGPRGIWNTETLEFDPIPVKPKPLTKFEFLALFTDLELAAILEAAKQYPLVGAVMLRLQMAEEVLLDNTTTIAGINGLRDGGLLTHERAAQILRGENV